MDRRSFLQALAAIGMSPLIPPNRLATQAGLPIRFRAA